MMMMMSPNSPASKTVDRISDYIESVVSPVSKMRSNDDSIYAPLAAMDVSMEEGEEEEEESEESEQEEDDICGIGANLILIHDPPLDSGHHSSSSTVAGRSYTYINSVQSVERHSSAYRAGIKAGDVVLEVDDIRFDYGREVYMPDDVAAMIRGRRGSGVRVVVERPGMNRRRLEFSLIRGSIGGLSKNNNNNNNNNGRGGGGGAVATTTATTMAMRPSSTSMAAMVVAPVTPESKHGRFFFGQKNTTTTTTAVVVTPEQQQQQQQQQHGHELFLHEE